MDAKPLRAVLSKVLGPGSRTDPQPDTRMAADSKDFGGALPRKRD